MGAPRKEFRLFGKLSEPISHYTDAVQCGDYLFMSGAGPFDTDLKLIGLGEIERQTEATLANIAKMLEAAGMSFGDVVYWRILLDNVRDQKKVDAALRRVTGKAKPATTYIGAEALALPGMLIEIEGVAYKPSAGAGPRREIMVPGVCDLGLHYSHVCKAGDLAWYSGVNASPIDEAGHVLNVGDPALQANQSYENLAKMCAAAGQEVADIAKVTVFIENVRHNQLLRPARARYHGRGRPTSAMIGIKELCIPGQHHQIEPVGYRATGSNPPRKEWVVPGYRKPISHYTDAVQCGDILFVSGAGGLEPNLKPVSDRDVVKQCEKTFEHIEAMLKIAGYGFDDVVKVTVYHTHVVERPLINPVRQRIFKKSLPASTLFGVRGLAIEALRLEIESIAYKPGMGEANRNKPATGSYD
jgi:enamine deaminase RidA (YjgF/YER057c/UK114 family)